LVISGPARLAVGGLRCVITTEGDLILEMRPGALTDSDHRRTNSRASGTASRLDRGCADGQVVIGVILGVAAQTLLASGHARGPGLLDIASNIC